MNNLATHKTRKRFAQHWLRSEKALSKIVAAAQLKSGTIQGESTGDKVLEIGPGTGALTRLLLPQVQTLVAVEIDRDLCKKLVKSFGKQDNFILLPGDILKLDLATALQDFPRFQNPNKVVANIPYNITGPIIEKLLGTIAHPNPHPYELIVLLVQKEVAHRLCAQPGGRNFGALSVRVQYLAQCNFICDVRAKAFYPPPKVDSAVVSLSPQPIAHPANDAKHLATLVKLGFANKRKMLRNNLKAIIAPSQLNQLLEQLAINPQARAEDLSVTDWVNLSNGLSARR